MSPGYVIQRYLPDDGSGVNWRLLSGNNRMVARGSRPHASADSCAEAIHTFKQRMADAAPRIKRAPLHKWTWELTVDEAPFAVSAHAFDRMIRCEQALSVFRVSFGEARVLQVVVDFGSRRWRRPEPSLLNGV